MNKLIFKYSWLLIPLLAIPYFTATGIICTGLDQLRYLGVAWHMYTNHNYLIPMVNGSYYPDKGPLFFWLISLGWRLFGVGLFWPQLLIVLLLVCTVWLTQSMYKLIFTDDNTGAELLPFIYIAAPIAFSLTLFRVDLIIAFISLAFNYAVLSYFYHADKRKYYKLIIIASSCIAVGLLTKGPVIYIFTLIPTLLMVSFYKNWRFIFIPSILGCLIGTGLVIFLWLIPAIEYSNHSYVSKILFHEIADRLQLNQSHKNFWIYLIAWGPALLLPWVVNFILIQKTKVVFKEFFKKAPLLVWICILALVIFSFWRQRFPWYIFPLAPYFIIIVTRLISSNISDIKMLKLNRSLTRCSVLLIFVMVLLFSFSENFRFFIFPDLHLYNHLAYFQIAALLLLFPMILFIFYQTTEFKTEIKLFAIIFSVATNFWLGFIGYAAFLRTNSVEVGEIMHATDQKQYPIIAYNSYYWGELGYIALLNHPIVEINNLNSLARWIKLNPHGLIISKETCPLDTKKTSAFYYSALALFHPESKDTIFAICSPNYNYE